MLVRQDLAKLENAMDRLATAFERLATAAELQNQIMIDLNTELHKEKN
jgi:hypothetical protein